MADTKVQKQSSEQQQGVARRQEQWPARDMFSLTPFSMMRRLTEEMDRAFSSAFGLERTMGERTWAPPIEVREHNGNLEICAELPGLEKNDIRVECTDEAIVIEGEKRKEHESEEGGWRRSERTYGHFYRAVPAPQGLDPTQIKAEFKNGVLLVTAPLPPREQSKSRQIPISS